jgi:hypothetical protein
MGGNAPLHDRRRHAVLVYMARPQVSLLSISVACLLAGMLLGFNLGWTGGRLMKLDTLGHERTIMIQTRGFPCPVEERYDDAVTHIYEFDKIALALNVAMGLFAVLSAGSIVELFVRGRKT